MPQIKRSNAPTRCIHPMDYPYGETRNATDRLAAFAKERRTVQVGEYVLLDDGTYDLHPDIRFAPGDRVPFE